jgi:hypothetical protein
MSLLLLSIGLAAPAGLLAQDPNPDSPAGPQQPAARPANPLQAFRGGKLEAPVPSDKDQRDFMRMVRGQEDAPTDPKRRKELFEQVLRYLIYRLTWENIHEGREAVTTRDIMEGSPGGMADGIFKAFPPPGFQRPAEDPEEAAKRERQRKYLAEMRSYATHYLREVLQNRLLIARLNAAIVLHRLAQYGQEDVLDELLMILEHPEEHLAVKHWAIKGIGELLSQASAKPPKDPKRMERAALAVFRWLDDATRMPVSLVEEMSEAERDGIRFIRREAIRALAAYRRPAISEDAKTGRREGPVAALLVRIMANEENNVVPSASLVERKEAAEALCQLQAKHTPSYQHDYAAFQVARLIAVLGAEADRDAARSTQRWKAFAAQLKNAFDTLAEDARNTPHAGYVNRLSARVLPVLEYLFDESKSAGSVSELNEYLAGNPPKSAEVYGPPPKQPGG